MSDPQENRIFQGPVEATLSLISGKYKAVILYHLFQQTPLRFGELRRLMPGTTQKMLTRQLRELEAEGLIHREVYAVVPPKTEYSITELGKTLAPVFHSMCEWGNTYMKDRIASNPDVSGGETC